MSSLAGSTSGMSRKNFQLAASDWRSGICSTILRAPLAFIGHLTTQSSQPMQSSGATWTVNLPPRAFSFGVLVSALLKVAGAPARAASS